jgi:hypothetical protein
VAVEMSWQMRRDGRWDAVERALHRIAREATDRDRITLVGFDDQTRVLAHDATPRDLQTLLASGKLTPPSGSADLAGAIAAVRDLARVPSSGLPTRVVFLVAHRKEFSDPPLVAAKPALGELTASRIPWRIVCLAPNRAADAVARSHNSLDLASDTIAMAPTAAALQNSLGEMLAGRAGTVAADVSLKLTFNPNVVSGYRLVGHEAETLTGPATDPLVIDLHADQSTTGLYELMLKPTGEVLAGVEVTWRDPAGGRPRRIARPIRRSNLSESFSQAPPWFQQGVVAAKTAEALRGSKYVPDSRPLDRVLELADQVHPRVAEQPTFQDLLTLVKQAEKSR